MAKPAFDPSKPFQPVATAKPAFDPSKPFQAGGSDPGALTSSAGGAFGRGVGQGLTVGFGDEAGGAEQSGLQAIANALPQGALRWAGIENYKGGETAPDDTYRTARGENRAQLNADHAQHPWASTAGDVVGGVPLSVITGGGAGAVGAMGMAAGLGNSTADLTHGDLANYGRAAMDTGVGGLASLATLGATRLVGAGVGQARNAIGNLTRDAEGRLADQIAEQQAAEIASLRGKLGAEVQKGNRLNENIDRLSPNIPTNLQMRAAALEQNGVLPDLRERLARANLGDLPGQKGAIDALDAELGQKIANAPAELQQRFSNALQAGPKMLANVVPAAAIGSAKSKLLHGAGAAIGGAIGGALGGFPGAGFGAAVGSSAINGALGVLKNPTAQVAGLNAVDSIMRAAQASGRFAQPFAEAYARGPQAVAALDYVLAQKDEHWRAAKAQQSPDATAAP